MQTFVATKSKDSYSSDFIGKPQFLDGNRGIRSYSYRAVVNGSLFLEENMLVILLGGQLNIRYGQADFAVCKNQMVFLKKETLIEYWTSDNHGEDMECIVFSLRHEVIKEFIKLTALVANSKDVTSIVIQELDQTLLKYIDSLEFYLAAPGGIAADLINIKLLELLFNLNSKYHQIFQQVLDLRDHFRPSINEVVQENILNSLSLQQLAVLAGRSLSSFRRDFISLYNMPPSQWIRQKKLQKAKELLRTTTMTVTDVCYTTGFENIAHFSRLFKSQFGYCPSEFRLGFAV